MRGPVNWVGCNCTADTTQMRNELERLVGAQMTDLRSLLTALADLCFIGVASISMSFTAAAATTVLIPSGHMVSHCVCIVRDLITALFQVILLNGRYGWNVSADPDVSQN